MHAWTGGGGGWGREAEQSTVSLLFRDRDLSLDQELQVFALLYCARPQNMFYKYLLNKDINYQPMYCLPPANYNIGISRLYFHSLVPCKTQLGDVTFMVI